MVSRLVWHLLSWRWFPGWRDRLARIRRVSRLDPAAFGTWQAEAVRRHLEWAGSTIPFFRDKVPPGAGLEGVPILTRDVLQAHESALRDPTRASEELRRETSGGSTGAPVVVWQDLAYRVWDHATEVFVTESMGIEPWARKAIIWGADRDVRLKRSRMRLYKKLLGETVVDAFRMGEEQVAAAALALEAHRPVHVLGYASALELMASWLLENRPGHTIRPKAVRSSAETLTPHVRDLIQRAFHAPVYDFYGSRESASIAAECRAGSMHVQAHGRVVEIVDASGSPCPPGEPGRILVTDLTNKAFGLIRYETGDVAAWSPDVDAPCPCGSVYPRLERILGRTSDFLTTPDGERIHGEWFTHLFYGRAGVSRFQVHQRDLNLVEVRTVGTATAADLEDLLAAMRERMGSSVDIRWIPVESIEATSTGKYRFTLSDVPYRTETS